MTEPPTESDGIEEADPVRKALDGLGLRNIGPALMGGRISTIAVHPDDTATWYVAAGSGGLWKTTNAGTTWTPVFEGESSYSIGAVAIDPNRPHVIWVGTGENVSGRHVAWGDGVHRSRNAGASWDRMGLEHSQHIAGILVDPRDSDVVFVAAEGPLWSAGGERGVYKTVDGGASWRPVLEIDPDTGVTSLVFAPDDPDTLYAAAYQRRRTVASFVGGGPGSGIHKSTDGGETWRRISQGLPEHDMGKIGLAVTPADPAVVYATIEAESDERGFYRSTDRGESWERRNEYISGGTGPHYYQELFASPADAELVYQVDVFLQVTRDGGATFGPLETGKTKHSDNHAVWIDPDRRGHLLVGTDAGLYETFDDGVSFRHFGNMPISQFYRVAVDDSLPFTSVVGGAQDLGTLLGPTRTRQIDGVRNQDWYVPLGADGYHAAFDPDDPDTCYLSWQQGNVMRLDRRTGELQDIRPTPPPGDPPERWNWDTPILVSPHDSGRVYVASQRVWSSPDRGDSWQAISPDLTRDLNRYELPVMGRTWSVDALYDHMAMSHYSTITTLTESPVAEGVLYAGTDDGLVQVSDDGGASWRAAAPLPDVPDDVFINAVEASRHDPDGAFVVADAHKNGDFDPYVFETDDRGRTWRVRSGDLPETAIVWAIEQDHVDPDLLFAGTEHGLHVTLDRGAKWHRLTKDVPTIAFRDLALQRRDGDLVAGTFGRGIYVLDDYTPLRHLDATALAEPAMVFPVRDGWWYVPYQPMQAPGQPTLGSTAFRAANPPFGVTITYHLSAGVEPAAKARRGTERQLDEQGDDVGFPGWDDLWEEHVAPDPAVLLVVRDDEGRAVRRIPAETEAGLHRASWDLRLAAPDPIRLEKPDFEPPWASPPMGPLVAPGSYTVELVIADRAGATTVTGRQPFDVVPVPGIDVDDARATAAFARSVHDLARRVAGAAKWIEATRERLRHLTAAERQTAHDGVFDTRIAEVSRRLEELARGLSGDPTRRKLSEPTEPSIADLVERVASHHWQTTQAPTETQRDDIERVSATADEVVGELTELVEVELAGLVADLHDAGAVWTPR